MDDSFLAVAPGSTAAMRDREDFLKTLIESATHNSRKHPDPNLNSQICGFLETNPSR